MAGSDSLPPNSYSADRRGLGRPVDRRNEAYAPSPYAAQTILPHSDVTPEGDRARHAPSMTSQVLTYGGAALAAAAVTAGAVLAVRKVADLVTGNDDLDRDADRAADRARERVYQAGRNPRSSAPAFARLDERERDEMRARARRRAEADRAAVARLRDEARSLHADRGQDRDADSDADQPMRRPRPEGARPRRPRPPQHRASGLGFLGDIEGSAQRMTHTVNNLVGTVGAALAAFRSVAGQAEGVMREFSSTADQLRGFLGSDGAAGRPTGEPRPFGRPMADRYQRPARRDVVDLRDDGDAADTGARTHRL